MPNEAGGGAANEHGSLHRSGAAAYFAVHALLGGGVRILPRRNITLRRDGRRLLVRPVAVRGHRGDYRVRVPGAGRHST